jgi:hypothetical protein
VCNRSANCRDLGRNLCVASWSVGQPGTGYYQLNVLGCGIRKVHLTVFLVSQFPPGKWWDQSPPPLTLYSVSCLDVPSSIQVQEKLGIAANCGWAVFGERLVQCDLRAPDSIRAFTFYRLVKSILRVSDHAICLQVQLFCTNKRANLCAVAWLVGYWWSVKRFFLSAQT